jgi:hypothetical protein
MKLVTFDEGRTGRVDDDTVVELDCGSTREYFERSGNVAETGAVGHAQILDHEQVVHPGAPEGVPS